jgi:hypothetical protein
MAVILDSLQGHTRPRVNRAQEVADFRPPRLSFLLTLAAIVVAYMSGADLVKRLFYRFGPVILRRLLALGFAPRGVA